MLYRDSSNSDFSAPVVLVGHFLASADSSPPPLDHPSSNLACQVVLLVVPSFEEPRPEHSSGPHILQAACCIASPMGLDDLSCRMLVPFIITIPDLPDLSFP